MTYKFIDGATREFNVTWGNVYYSDIGGIIMKAEETVYHVIVTKNPRARLDSICAIRKEMA